MLLARKPENVKPETLVFPSPEGLAIDDHSFSQRCWKFILKKLGIEHRTFYTTRHTFISHCLEAGMNPVKVAAITGHDVKTLLGKYAGAEVLNPDIKLNIRLHKCLRQQIIAPVNDRAATAQF